MYATFLVFKENAQSRIDMPIRKGAGMKKVIKLYFKISLVLLIGLDCVEQQIGVRKINISSNSGQICFLTWAKFGFDIDGANKVWNIVETKHKTKYEIL